MKPALIARKAGTAASLVKFWLAAAPNGQKSPEELADFVLSYRGVAPAQVRSELHRFGELIEKQRSKVVMEVGTRHGGTLFMFCRLSHPNATIISVDLPRGPYGGGYEFFRVPVLNRMAQGGQKLHLIRADSHQPETKLQVTAVLEEQPVDFLFIDGDHTYEGVKKDFEMYSPLVRRGGIVAFHDIVPHPPQADCGVDLLWNEIKGMYAHTEIVERADQGWAGIGVLFI